MISNGHTPSAAWGYTPVQANAFLELAELRQRKERAHLLATNAMAARGKAEDVTAKINKDWSD